MSQKTNFPIQSQWSGKKVAFLGDSITDAKHIGTEKNYWQFLQEYLGIVPLVYGLNGQKWLHILPQAEELKKEHGDDVDAIMVLAGTNDYNHGVPLGEWWTCIPEEVNSHGILMQKPRRHLLKNPDTFRGRINIAMEYLKSQFPRQQILLLTLLHRGFAEFGGDNIQPEESFPNDIGLYADSYVDVIKEAGNIWSVPVIDLNSLCGLLPTLDAYAADFHDSRTDRLHPGASGHRRIAQTLLYQMLALPSDFK